MNLPFSTMKQQFVVIKRRASLAETITCEKVLRRANRGNSHPLTRIRNQSVSEEIPWCSDLPARVRHVRREERREERTQQKQSYRVPPGRDWLQVRNSMVRDRGFLCIYLAYRDAPGRRGAYRRNLLASSRRRSPL